MKRSGRITSLFISIMMVMPMVMPFSLTAGAYQGGVLRASDLEEYIDATEAGSESYISIDKRTAAVDGESFEAFFDRDFNGDSASELKEAIEEDRLYVVTGEDGRSFEALSVFGAKRIKVKKELSSLEGASKGVSFGGDTLLSYDTAEQTRDAYERLSEKYGPENVIVDLPVYSADSSSGWGTEYMNLDDQTGRVRKESADGLPKVTVAVIDSGINSSHVIFKGTSISPYSKSMLEEDGDINDENGHGTSVAGIIAESTPDNVEIMAVKVFKQSTNSTTEYINQAIQYSVENGADIINLSMSSNLLECIDSLEAYYPNLVENYLRETNLQLMIAANKGVIVCASSGNEGQDLDAMYAFPSYSEYTLAVGAINKNGSRLSFSNYGDSLDFCAPGGNLMTASNKSSSGYYMMSGTSFAAPYISACCAYVKMNDPDADHIKAREELIAISVDYGSEGKDKYYGWGMPRYEDFDDPDALPVDIAKAPAVRTVTVNTKTVNASSVKKAIKKAGGTAAGVRKIVLGRKVRRIKKSAFKGTKAGTLVIKTKKLSKKSVKGSLKGSKIKTVKTEVSSKAKIRKKYIKKYRKIFTKKNSGRKVKVK